MLDAYQGQYTDKFRCWTGEMLVVRNVLFILFAANGSGDPDVNPGTDQAGGSKIALVRLTRTRVPKCVH